MPRIIMGVLLLLSGFAPAVSAQVSERTYELAGRVRVGGKSPGTLQVMVFLNGASSPFFASTPTDPAGNYKFKKLLPGMYRLSVLVSGWGHSEETVDIGPTTANRRGRVSRDVEFRKRVGSDGGATVSPAELSLPSRATQAFRKADEHLNRRDVEGAIRELKKAVEAAPEYAAAWNRLGTIAFQTGRYAEAEGYFSEALRQEPTLYPPKVNLGAAQLVLGKLDLALETNRDAVRERPDDPLAHSQLGQVYFALGSMDRAEDSLRMARSLDPGHFSWPQLVLAEIYRQRQDYHSMARELAEFLHYHPDAAASPKLTELLEDLKRRGIDPGLEAHP